MEWGGTQPDGSGTLTVGSERIIYPEIVSKLSSRFVDYGSEFGSVSEEHWAVIAIVEDSAQVCCGKGHWPLRRNA